MGGGGRGGFNMNGHEVSPEELFEMFFNGGGMRGRRGGMHSFHFGGGGMPRHAQNFNHREGGTEGATGAGQRGAGGFMQMLQILPLILLFVMSFGGFGSGGGHSNDPYGNGRGNLPYAFQPMGKFTTLRETTLLGDSIHIPFYVTDQFTTRYGRSLTDLRKVEKQVYLEYKEILGTKCFTEKDYKRKRIESVSASSALCNH